LACSDDCTFMTTVRNIGNSVSSFMLGVVVMVLVVGLLMTLDLIGVTEFGVVVLFMGVRQYDQ